MLKLITILSLSSGFWFYFNKINTSNTLKLEAAAAYNDHFYSQAASIYKEILTKYDTQSEEVKLNLAHSLYKAQAYEQAIKYYTELLVASNTDIRSAAQVQLGIIQHKTKRYKLALFYFKEALHTNPENKTAAYNYELLKRKLIAEEQAAKNSKSSGGKKPDEQNEFNPEGDEETDLFHSSLYQQQNISKQRAEKILQYLQEQETQYYQQIQKHVPQDKNKPDW